MTGIYYADMVDVARAAGLTVQIPAVCVGWEQRARSSGGFPSPPLCAFHHHTASNTSPGNDLAYMIDGCDDAPVGNWLIDRAGICYPIAAGASNCAGKGGPLTFSRGRIPADSGNTRGWQIECANAGTGVEPWPVAQVDALFALSNALNAHVDNRPDDVTTHALGAGDGWTNRKIDPATAAAVEGPWRPRSTNSSGTWSLADIRAECSARAEPGPAPDPDPDLEDDVFYLGLLSRHPANGIPYVVAPDLSWKTELSEDEQGFLASTGLYLVVPITPENLDRMPSA